QRLALDVGEAEMTIAGNLVRTVVTVTDVGHARLVGFGDRRTEPLGETIPQRTDAGDCRRAALDGSARGSGHADDAGDIVSTTAPLVLLAAPEQQWFERDPVAHHERSDTLGAPELVRADRDEIGIGAFGGDVDPHERVYGIG